MVTPAHHHAHILPSLISKLFTNVRLPPMLWLAGVEELEVMEAKAAARRCRVGGKSDAGAAPIADVLIDADVLFLRLTMHLGFLPLLRPNSSSCTAPFQGNDILKCESICVQIQKPSNVDPRTSSPISSPFSSLPSDVSYTQFRASWSSPTPCCWCLHCELE